MIKNYFKSLVVAILVWEARLFLRRHKPKIIGVTGSVGKTSTKDAIYAVLKNHLHVRKSEKNYNSDIGASLTILGLRNGWSSPYLWLKNVIDGFFTATFSKECADVLVLELGIDRPGDMKRLTEFITPDIVVLTRLPDVPAHVEFFSSAQQVREEKLLLVEALTVDGVLIYNNDDELIRTYVEENVRQQSFGYSRYSESDFTASGDCVVYDGAFPTSSLFTIAHNKQQVRVPVRGSLGVQHAYNYAAAIAVASQFDISLQSAADALSSFAPPRGRMKLIAGIKNTLIIDDTYNASPIAMQYALQTVKELDGNHRKVAILGDMLELGKYSVDAHMEVGTHVAESTQALVTIGLRSHKIAEGAISAGMDVKHIVSFDDVHAALSQITSHIQSGDIILVKGSQSIRTELIVKALMSQPEQAAELLVRQEASWQG